MTKQRTILGFSIYEGLLRSPTVLTGLILAAAALVAGCTTAPAEPASMIDEQANFADYKTFGWLEYEGAEPMSIVDTKIRAAITAEMLRKGYVEELAGATADLLLDYQAARTEKVKSKPFSIGIGVGSYGSGGGGSISTRTSNVKNVTEGSLVINAVDSARNAEVWRSAVSRELGENPVDSGIIKKVVTEVFSDFPARTATQ